MVIVGVASFAVFACEQNTSANKKSPMLFDIDHRNYALKRLKFPHFFPSPRLALILHTLSSGCEHAMKCCSRGRAVRIQIFGVESVTNLIPTCLETRIEYSVPNFQSNRISNRIPICPNLSVRVLSNTGDYSTNIE